VAIGPSRKGDDGVAPACVRHREDAGRPQVELEARTPIVAVVVIVDIRAVVPVVAGRSGPCGSDA